MTAQAEIKNHLADIHDEIAAGLANGTIDKTKAAGTEWKARIQAGDEMRNLFGSLAMTGLDSAATTVTLATSSAVAMQAITGVRPWSLNATFNCIATGGTATLRGQGMFLYDTAALLGGFGLVSTAGANADLTLAQTIKLVATWGTSSASNTITVTNFKVTYGATNG